MLAELSSFAQDNLLAVLHKCRHNRDATLAKHILLHLRKQRLELHPVICNYLIPTLVDCGLLPDAHRVFDKLHAWQRNAHSWMSIISGYINIANAPVAFLLYSRMEAEQAYVQPNACIYLALVAACGRYGDIGLGLELHAAIIKRGLDDYLFEGSPTLGNALIDMYDRCYCLEESYWVFDALRVQDVSSWNTMITGCVELYDWEKAGILFHQMQLHGICPNSVTLSSCLRVCCTQEAWEKGQELHAETIRRGLERDLFVGSTLVYMYMKCSLLNEACHVFDGLPLRNATSWAALIAGHAEHRLDEKLLHCFKTMHSEGVPADAVTFVLVLKACGSMRTLDIGHEIHAEIVKKGLEREVYIGSALVTTYSKCGSLAEACQVFDGLSARNSALWNSLIVAFLEHSLVDDAHTCFWQMQMEGIIPDTTTFSSCLKGCSTVMALDKGQEIHVQAVKQGLEVELYVGSALVDMYVKCSLPVEAQIVFDQLPIRNTVSWEAVNEPCNLDQAANIVEFMELDGVSPDAFVCSGGIKSCSVLRDINGGREFHAEAVKRGLEREEYVSSALIDMYSKCRCIDEAQLVFNRMHSPKTVLWNSLIGGYVKNELLQDVENCLKEMELDGLLPDSVTLIFKLKSFGNKRLLERIQEVYAELALRGLERDSYVGNTLVDVYAKCGCLTEAKVLFDRLPIKDNLLEFSDCGICRTWISPGGAKLLQTDACKLCASACSHSYFMLGSLY